MPLFLISQRRCLKPTCTVEWKALGLIRMVCEYYMIGSKKSSNMVAMEFVFAGCVCKSLLPCNELLHLISFQYIAIDTSKIICPNLHLHSLTHPMKYSNSIALLSMSKLGKCYDKPKISPLSAYYRLIFYLTSQPFYP